MWSERGPLRYERLTWPEVRRSAAAAADRVVLLPPVPHGDDPHHMDFPGPITIAWEGAILFFELTQLGQAGSWPSSSGGHRRPGEVRLERAAARSWPRTKSIEQVLEEHLEPSRLPVLYKLPVGHAEHLATLPLGVPATLDADARTLTVDQPALGPADGGQRCLATGTSRAWGMIDPTAGPRPTSQEACAWRPASR